MKNILNYSQPNFYSFNEDSLELINFSKGFIKSSDNSLNLLDLCAGCGVIGIEAKAHIQAVGKVTFVELQSDFIPFINENLLNAECNDFEVFEGALSEQSFGDHEFDLIFSNPPYFLPENGRISPNEKRQICRSFQVDGWSVFFMKVRLWLKPKGLFFITVRDFNTVSTFLEGFRLVEKKKVGASWLICLSRLDID